MTFHSARAGELVKTPLSAQQQRALARLHQAATQFEGIFLDMLFKAMRDTVPHESIFGKTSAAQDTFQQMLDEQRAQEVAKTGSFGIARILEQQLRASVLADAKHEARVNVPTQEAGP